MKFVKTCCAVVMGLMLLSALPAHADVYMSADFSGGVLWPNTTVGTFDGMDKNNNTAVTGHFVYDSSLIPGAASGYVNVFQNMPGTGFPDVGLIPSAVLFTINLGSNPVTFLFGDAKSEGSYNDSAIQYNNGKFNGFFFVSDFGYNGKTYEFSDQGTLWSISTVVNGIPQYDNVASGYINTTLTNIQPYDPGQQSAVTPEPGTMLLMGVGVVGAALMHRRKMRAGL